MIEPDKAVQVGDGNSIAIRDENSVIEKSEVITCHNCGYVINLSTVFCPNCRELCSTENKGKVVKRSICPHCNTPNDMDKEFCAYCFFDLSNAPVEEFSVDYIEAAQLEDEKILQAVLKNGKVNRKVCSICGTLNAEEDIFCSYCGMEILITLPSKYCQFCGGKNQSDARLCCHCQASFENDENISDNFWACKCKHVNQSGAVFCEDCGRAKDVANPLKNKLR